MDPLVLLAVGLASVLGGILLLRLHPFIALILAALLVSALTPESGIRRFAESKKMSDKETETIVKQTIGKRVATALGGTATKVGILIALAAIIGQCMLESGAADRIVRGFISGFGEARAGLAFALAGFLLGIPVYFDTVFFLMIPLAKSLALRTGKNYCLYILAVIAGGSISHSLVPPTPGPLLVAGELGVSMGDMIIAGFLIGGVASTAGYLYARWFNRTFDLPVREAAPGQLDELRALADKDVKELPGLVSALAPIVLPVLFVTFQTVLGSPFGKEISGDWPKTLLEIFRTLGDPVVALAIAAAFAMTLLAQQKRGGSRDVMESIPGALKDAGVIILITSAGGAFGGILQQTGIGPRLQEVTGGMTIGLLPLAWFITAVVRVAQGSATVAMITAVGIVGGVATPETLGFSPVYLAVAIGCGSKMLPWFNDSGFWVVCKMSGFTERETLKSFTPLLSIMGFTGLLATMVLAKLWPQL
ncbi:MAG: GntP family permease [Verrucomicrobiae bacterium]|nr:GntP family permease [Verrucomicrobiae bacterium]